MEVRRAQELDLENILDILSFYNFKIIRPLDNSPIDDHVGDTLTLYNSVSEIDLQNAFVAVYDEKIVGFSHYKHVKEKTAKTTIMTVLPEYRKLGIGKHLQIARMKDAYDRGYRKLITYCDTPNVADWYIKNFKYKVFTTELNHHRLHFLKISNEVIWAVHYGFYEFKNCKVLICDLDIFFHL